MERLCFKLEAPGFTFVVSPSLLDGLGSSHPPDLFALISIGILRIPNRPKKGAVKITASKYVYHCMEVQAMFGMNELTPIGDGTQPACSYRNIPIEVVD